MGKPKDKPEDCIRRGGHEIAAVRAWSPFEPGGEIPAQTGQCIHCGGTFDISNKDVKRVIWEIKDDR